MAKKTATKKTTPRKPTSGAGAKKATKIPAKPADAARANTAAQTPRRKPPKAPTPSCLDSAAAVLKDAPDEGLSVKEMVALMAAKGLWTSPAGKTPEATVYAGIIREIGRKGKLARFRKVSRGRFALAAPTSA
ncbi:MAG: hypothetical protein D6692_00850 [Planctomycetota bacterium]|nr:MAG: hypothetical protein D6692_00850 [Planctomycetota bacterium]